jgi:LPXTG-motif cell wall-anchored protein
MMSSGEQGYSLDALPMTGSELDVLVVAAAALLLVGGLLARLSRKPNA